MKLAESFNQNLKSVLELFSFPTPYEEIKDKETGLKIRMFYEGELGCLTIEAGDTLIKLEQVAFVPEATDQLIGNSFLARAGDCGTYYQDVFFGGPSVGPCTLVFSKDFKGYGFKVYSESYRPFHDKDDKMKPVFEWEGKEWEYMMALKGFMEQWPYEHIDKMSFE